MNPAAPNEAPPRRINACKHVCKHGTTPPCLREAQRRRSPHKITGFNDFMVRACISVHVCFNREPKYLLLRRRICTLIKSSPGSSFPELSPIFSHLTTLTPLSQKDKNNEIPVFLSGTCTSKNTICAGENY